jgi:hypothetical protein
MNISYTVWRTKMQNIKIENINPEIYILPTDIKKHVFFWAMKQSGVYSQHPSSRHYLPTTPRTRGQENWCAHYTYMHQQHNLFNYEPYTVI